MKYGGNMASKTARLFIQITGTCQQWVVDDGHQPNFSKLAFGAHNINCLTAEFVANAIIL